MNSFLFIESLIKGVLNFCPMICKISPPTQFVAIIETSKLPPPESFLEPCDNGSGKTLHAVVLITDETPYRL